MHKLPPGTVFRKPDGPYLRSNSLESIRQPMQRADTWHKEILATAKHVERFYPGDAVPDRLAWNGKCRAFLLQADNRVTFVADAYEISIVDPFLLQEFDRGHCLGADE